MNRLVYSTLLHALSPALLAWMALRARRSGGQWQVFSRVRFGCYSELARQRAPVWIHAVSLGETRAALPLIQALIDRGDCVLLTHLTATGREEGARCFQDAIKSGQLVQQWLPYDFPWATRRFMRQYRPRIGVLIEREVWPNLVRAACLEKVPMILASARFSDRSLHTSLRAGRVMREAFAGFRAVLAQTVRDAQRLELAGAVSPGVSGNFKFDVRAPEAVVGRGRAFAAALGRPVITVASTREGEEAQFIEVIRRLVERCTSAAGSGTSPLFFIVPRHPQRFAEVANLLEQSGLAWARRSILLERGDDSASTLDACRSVSVVLGDTLGEMPWYYAASKVAIVGGSFAPLGGQNFIEACAIGVPVVFGPHTFNFKQAALDAIEAGAARRATTAAEALELAVSWLDTPRTLSQMADAGRHWVACHAGSVQRVLNAMQDLAPAQVCGH